MLGQHRGLNLKRHLVGLAALSVGLALVLGGAGYRTAGRLGDTLKQATAASSAAYHFMLGDMMHDALHADVLIALRAGSGAALEARRAAAADMADHARTFRDALAALRGLDLDTELQGAIAAAERPLEAYIANAEVTAALASTDGPAAEARYDTAFFADFEALEAANERIGKLIDARGAAIGAEGQATTALAQAALVAVSLGASLVVAFGTAALVASIARRDASEARMRHMAHHDALTSLPNRGAFRECLDRALARARRDGSTVGVLCLDLDRFKAVNDTLGHPAGDALLRAVAERLQGCVRKGDTVARLGGDEFAVLQVGLERPEEAGALARRLVEVLAAPFDVEGHQVVAGTSVGIALAPGDGEAADELLKKADVALYRAKADGRGTFRSFEPGMDARLQARRLLELDLRKALAGGGFEVHYQPLVGLRSGAVTAFEALLRWHHPERGMVSPADFIPAAEETGLIVPLGRWVLRRACADAAGWPEGVRVAVNLSAVQFKERDLAATVAEALAAAGLRPDRLEVEITETALLEDADATLATLRELRALGVRIAMDDFGTGYSSLGYLRSFPFDKIKIDRCFVKDIGTSADCRAIVRAVTSLGGSLGISTTAEGVETAEQLERLRAEGCDEAQGYYLGRPGPAGGIAAVLRAGTAHPCPAWDGGEPTPLFRPTPAHTAT